MFTIRHIDQITYKITLYVYLYIFVVYEYVLNVQVVLFCFRKLTMFLCSFAFPQPLAEVI